MNNMLLLVLFTLILFAVIFVWALATAPVTESWDPNDRNTWDDDEGGEDDRP